MLLASFLIVFVVFGCVDSAGPAASSTAPCSGGASAHRSAPESAASPELPEPQVAAERISAPRARTGEQALIEQDGERPEEDAPVEPAPGDSSDSAFGGARDLDDPFAAIGPAFSGIAFQSYNSGCDPFEDKYGTCL